MAAGACRRALSRVRRAGDRDAGRRRAWPDLGDRRLLDRIWYLAGRALASAPEAPAEVTAAARPLPLDAGIQGSDELVFDLSVGGHPGEDIQGELRRLRRSVRALLHEGAVDVANRQDPGEVVDLLSLQTVGIAAAVEIFMMMAHDVVDLRGDDRRLRAKIVVADAGMTFDDVEFLARQLSRLVQNFERYFRFADVVQQPGNRDRQNVGSAHAGAVSERGRNPGDDQAVLERTLVIAAHGVQPFGQADVGDRLDDLIPRL